MNNKEGLSIKDILEIEKNLINENISVDTYLDYFFIINTACSTGIAKNPLRLYLALRNANVIVNADENDNLFEAYKNVVNTVKYLIQYYAKEYITEDVNLEKYSESLQASILQNNYVNFEMFKKSYYLFELYVLAGIRGNKFFEFINLLNGVYVKTDKGFKLIRVVKLSKKHNTVNLSEYKHKTVTNIFAIKTTNRFYNKNKNMLIKVKKEKITKNVYLNNAYIDFILG